MFVQLLYKQLLGVLKSTVSFLIFPFWGQGVVLENEFKFTGLHKDREQQD